MANFIVDCRYENTTTPLGQPDFTLEIEANSLDQAQERAAEEDTADHFIVTGACETLDLVKMLRQQVQALYGFAVDLLEKRGVPQDGRDFDEVLAAQGITLQAPVEKQQVEPEDDDDAGDGGFFEEWPPRKR